MADEASNKEWQQLGSFQASTANAENALVATGSAANNCKSNLNSIFRGVAQLVARLLWEQNAAGSSPVTPTKIADSSARKPQSRDALRLFDKEEKWI